MSPTRRLSLSPQSAPSLTSSRDQELRFTVHDSPDYYRMKVSVFNDDKKTDIIGETWVNLENVVVPGGGQSDTWHGLTCKGKYAGEIRLELTYYDTRQATMEATAASERKRHSTHQSHLGGPREHAPVKRRPLPATVATSVSAPPIIVPSDPAAAPAPERVPRGFQTPPQTAAPFSPDDFNSFAQPPMDELGYGYPVQPVGHPSPYSRRGSIAPPHALRSSQEFRARRQSHLEMPHAHSAPIIPHYHHDPDVGMDRLTQYPPELPPLDGYDYDEPQFAPYGAAYRSLQPTVEDEDDAADVRARLAKALSTKLDAPITLTDGTRTVTRPRRALGVPRDGARILFFTGVRYCREDADEPARPDVPEAYRAPASGRRWPHARLRRSRA